MKLSDAIESPALPCNPIPFAQGLIDGCQENGTDFIRSREGQRILWVLMAQSYGDLARIDLTTEYVRLTQEENSLYGE